MTLAEINDELGAARTNKKEFLEKLETIIPWETFFELIQPSCYKGELGNKPYPLELMLRIFILQNVYCLLYTSFNNIYRSESCPLSGRSFAMPPVAGMVFTRYFFSAMHSSSFSTRASQTSCFAVNVTTCTPLSLIHI